MIQWKDVGQMRKAIFTRNKGERECEMNDKVSLMFPVFGVFSSNNILQAHGVIFIVNLTKS